MFDPETQAFIESGCGLIVGTVSEDGAPHAGRAWGLDVVDNAARPTVRLLLDVDDERSIAHLVDGGAVAVTATNIVLLRSIQMKGRALGTKVGDAGDEARAERYIQQFHADVESVDNVPWSQFERIVPRGYVACRVEVHETFDQTPGPGAGARIEGVR